MEKERTKKGQGEQMKENRLQKGREERDALFPGPQVSSNRVLYTPSAFARNHLLHLQETGTLKTLRSHVSERSGLDSYLFFLVCSGSGTVSYLGETMHLSEGDCFFIDCRKRYSHCSDSGDQLWSLKWTHFSGINMAGIYEKYRERGGRPAFHSKDPGRYATLLDELYEIALSESHVRDMEISTKLMEILTVIMSESWNGGRKKGGAPKRRLDIYKVKGLLDRRFSEKITLDLLAETFYVHKDYLGAAFKKTFGVTVNGYLGQVRITEAKRMLRFTDRSEEEIAELVGFSEANYFIRAFRKVEGITPGEFRRRWNP